MSKFSRFMKANKKAKENGKYAPTNSLTDESGKPLEWEFRPLTSKENEEIRDSCTIEVQVTGKPNVFRPKLNTSKYLAKMIVAATIYPDLYDKELQDSYGVMTPEDLLYALVDNAGEYQDFSVWMQKYQGFTKTFDEKVEEAKN
ncbi:MAG: hypothetical protein NC094_08900 [Bacteroidales bacterium]|nr:hypothetical protein [Ruminococcus flavefaciens]MCM1326963.1 hypothetical protein [Lachnoclostridium sp.]MCM1373611.1 hypothetical protein [Muribaculum sp.]MCM1385123.1 hypothetical protein [Lachnoclostridium sp.]MCM1465523.1 hypothetical protein [Bacteroidales bacterium]